jgi:malate dehydrogenase (oxaloacetate-decarboxylating)
MLNGGASEITDAHLIAAAEAIADVVGADELNASYIVPSVFDPRVAVGVAEAVEAAVDAGKTRQLSGRSH